MGNETIGLRLTACRNALGLTQSALAEKIDLSVSTLKKIEADGNVPGGETLLRYASLGFNPGWILTGIGGMRLDGHRQWQSQSQAATGTNEETPEGVVMVEQLAFSASAGNGAMVLDDLGPSFPVQPELLRRLGLRPEHTRMVEAVGSSMLPTIQDREMLLVDTSPAARELIRDGDIYLFTIDSEAYLKRLRRDLGQWIIVSDNHEHFPPRPIPKGERFEIIGRVCWGARELRSAGPWYL